MGDLRTATNSSTSDRHVAAVWHTVACIERKDTAGADRHAAASLSIHSSPLLQCKSETEVFDSFAERMQSLEDHCVQWSIHVREVEALTADVIFVTWVVDVVHQAGCGVAALAAAVFECADGLVTRMSSFSTVDEARWFAQQRCLARARSA